MSLEEEVWRDISGFEGLYQVSNLGRIKTLITERYINRWGGYYIKQDPKIMKLSLYTKIKSKMYYRIQLCKGKRYFHFTVHRLVADAFIPNPEEKPQVNHIDGNKLNNHVSNLEWVTDDENKKHAKRSGMIWRGHSINTSKLEEDQVIEIRRLFDTGNYTKTDIAKMFKISVPATSSILKRENWGWLI